MAHQPQVRGYLWGRKKDNFHAPLNVLKVYHLPFTADMEMYVKMFP